MREAYERAEEAYARDLALYEAETERWNAAWRAAGKEPPPTPRVKPTQPKANWGTCRDCAGFGLDFHEEYCRECGGTGDARAVAAKEKK